MNKSNYLILALALGVVFFAASFLVTPTVNASDRPGCSANISISGFSICVNEYDFPFGFKKGGGFYMGHYYVLHLPTKCRGDLHGILFSWKQGATNWQEVERNANARYGVGGYLPINIWNDVCE